MKAVKESCQQFSVQAACFTLIICITAPTHRFKFTPRAFLHISSANPLSDVPVSVQESGKLFCFLRCKGNSKETPHTRQRPEERLWRGWLTPVFPSAAPRFSAAPAVPRPPAEPARSSADTRGQATCGGKRQQSSASLGNCTSTSHTQRSNVCDRAPLLLLPPLHHQLQLRSCIKNCIKK